MKEKMKKDLILLKKWWVRGLLSLLFGLLITGTSHNKDEGYVDITENFTQSDIYGFIGIFIAFIGLYLFKIWLYEGEE